MRQKILLFLAFPLFIFGTIEMAKDTKPKKDTAAKEMPAKTPSKVEATQKKAPLKKVTYIKTETKKIPTEKETHLELPEEEYPSSAANSPTFMETGYQKQFFTTLIFICVLIVFALVVVYMYRRASPMSKITKKNNRNNIKILERRSISPQTYLYHIQVGDKQFIISESKVDVRSIATLDWPERK